jgi:hypothetical protein
MKNKETSCGRQIKGMPDNCALCRELSKNIYYVCVVRGKDGMDLL